MVYARFIIVAILLATQGGCFSGASEPLNGGALAGRLTITGSSTVAPLVSEIAQRFESLHPGARIDVQTGGSSRGLADVRRGIADIGMISRALTPEESDFVAHAIALDGISMILHADNPVSELTDEQVIAIYTGRITNWSELGGNDAPITVVNKAEGRSTLELFLEHFQLAKSDILASVVIGDNQHGILTVAGDPQSIAYVSIGSAIFEAERGVRIKLISLDGIAPTMENVHNSSFPMTRPLNLVTQGETSPLAQSFIEFASSREVNDLVEAQFFVPTDN